MDERYRLVFRGEVLDGQHPAVVKKRLQALMKVSDEHADAMFAGKPVVLRQDADTETSARFQKAFKEAGARLRVMPVGAAEDLPAEAEPGSVADAVESSEEPSLAEPGALLSTGAGEPASQAPDTSHISLAVLGVDLGQPVAQTPVVIPEVGWDLAPPGTALGVESVEAEVVIDVDIVDFEIEPPGVRMDRRTKKLPPNPPDTSHLEVETVD